MAAPISGSIGLQDLYLTATHGRSHAERSRAEDVLITRLTLVLREIGRESKSLKDFTGQFEALRNKETPLVIRIHNLARTVKTFKWPTEFVPNKNQQINQLNTFFAEAKDSATLPLSEDEKKEALPTTTAEAPAAPARQTVYGYLYSSFNWFADTRASQFLKPVKDWIGEAAPVAWMVDTTPIKAAVKYITAPVSDEESPISL